MSRSSATRVLKLSVRSYAALMAALGVLFVWLSTKPDGGFVKGFFQGGALGFFALAVFLVVSSVRHSRRDDLSTMWRPSEDVRTEDASDER